MYINVILNLRSELDFIYKKKLDFECVNYNVWE